MTVYARLNAESDIERRLDLTADEYAALEANGKAAWLRLWIVDDRPVPGVTQVVTDAGIVITTTEARQTWSLREKTQDELAAEENEAERVRLRTVIANLAASVQTPDTTGTAGERLTKLEARSLRLERIALWLLRSFT